ncbi:uncharacterized protein [Elaeis guineensis]|uniref:uncharacterized protein n=1 Tax=Elaeis guineensis var. tenera TaxID=51953 RepID=UPI003C6D8BD2
MPEIQIEDFLEEDYRPLRKRPKKNNAPLKHPPSQAIRKMKPSKFHAPTRLRIGAWEHVSRHEGDLEAKCYFARQKLIWEFLESGLKSKIEIPWSHIKGLKVTYPETGDGTLDIKIARPPLFYKETDPQPRKHTIWRPTTDFTGFQASIHRHFLECEQDSLRENMDMIFQCNPRLYFLSQQPEDESKSPYSDPQYSVFADQLRGKDHAFDSMKDGNGSTFSEFCVSGSHLCDTSSISMKSMVPVSVASVPDPVSQEIPSASTGMESQAWSSAGAAEELEESNWWDQTIWATE